MQLRAVTHLIALTTVLSQSVGKLVIAPHNTESKVGDSTYFNCSTDLTYEDIFWFHGENYIYTGSGILHPYNGRFKIDRNASIGSHNLVIRSVQPSDAGEYFCIDAEGGGTSGSAQLAVLDNDPDCHSNIHKDGVIGQNIFNIPPDKVQLTCAVTYHGNILPQMEWRKVGDNSSIKASVTSNVTSNNRLIYILNFNGDIAIDKSSYVCQTKRSTESQYKCTSEIIKVLYYVGGNTTELNVVRGDKIACIVRNSTFSCTSQWYHDNYTCPLSCDETLTTHLLGEYMCTVKCQVRGKDYYFEALKAFVVEPIMSPPMSTSGTLVTAVVLPIVLIIAVASIAALIVRNRQLKKKYEQKMNEEENRLNEHEQRMNDGNLMGKPLSLSKICESEISNDSHKLSPTVQFLVENIKSSHLTDLLHKKNCITDQELDQLMNPPTDDNYTNDALVQWMRTFLLEEEKGQKILECIRETKQHFIADLLEMGGVVIKCMLSTELVKAKLFTKSSSKSAEKLKEKRAMVIERLNRPQGFPLSGVLGATSKIPLDDIIIAPYCYQVGNYIVIWFWCKSKDGEDNLQALLDQMLPLLKTLYKIFKQFSKESESSVSTWLFPNRIEIFEELFKEKVAEEGIELLYKIDGEVRFNERKICGVAILNEALYVVHEKSSTLQAYNCSNFRSVRSLKVTELICAHDMCSCKRNNCLYIMDRKTGKAPREVLKISTDGNVVQKWLTVGNTKGKLSTSEGNVIITVEDKQMLLEYSSDGKLERVIYLPDCEGLRHAIKRDDHYIVSHGDYYDSFNRVCIVDKNGHTKKSFGDHFGSAENQLHIPHYLAAGSSGCVIVADLFNDRVLLLDSNLKFKTKIVPKNKQRFVFPERVSLSETLLVVQISADLYYETTSEEEGDSRKETKDDIWIQIKDVKHGGLCRIMVFDIRQLLEKYNS